MTLDLLVQDLGKISYGEAWEIQKDFFEKRKLGKVSDTLLFAEHPPTITFGINNEWNVLHVSQEELKSRGIEFFKADRGGGAAYLGPGQLVGYTIMDIKPYGNVLQFMRLLEDVMINTASDFKIKVGRYDVKNPKTEKPYRATQPRFRKMLIL